MGWPALVSRSPDLLVRVTVSFFFFRIPEIYLKPENFKFKYLELYLFKFDETNCVSF
jgi:hypothetical protein